MQALFSYGGLPFGTTSNEQQVRELNNRVYKLADKIERLNKQEKAIEKKADEKAKAKTGPNAPFVDPFDTVP